MPEVPFEGFHYDAGRASAMADAIRATFEQARRFQVTVPDQLAALGIVAAELMAQSRLRTAVSLGAMRLADFIVNVATTLPQEPRQAP